MNNKLLNMCIHRLGTRLKIHIVLEILSTWIYRWSNFNSKCNMVSNNIRLSSKIRKNINCRCSANICIQIYSPNLSNVWPLCNKSKSRLNVIRMQNKIKSLLFCIFWFYRYKFQYSHYTETNIAGVYLFLNLFKSQYN